MKTSDLPPEFRSAKALLAHVRAQRVAALKARFPPWYARQDQGDGLYAAAIKFAMVMSCLMALVSVITFRCPWPWGHLPLLRDLMCDLIVNAVLPVAALFVVALLLFESSITIRSKRFSFDTIDASLRTPAGRAAALAEAVDSDRVRTEAIERLNAFLERERTEALCDDRPVGFRDSARSTGIRISLVNEVAERVRFLPGMSRMDHESNDEHDLSWIQDGAGNDGRDRAVRFERAYDQGVAAPLHAAFTR